MAEPLIPLPIPDLTRLIQPILAVLSVYGAAKIGPPFVQHARQRAYDEVSAAEAVRLVISPPLGLTPDPDLAIELIRAIHPRQRRGFDGWRVGWPTAELRVVSREGEVAWEVVTNRQLRGPDRTRRSRPLSRRRTRGCPSCRSAADRSGGESARGQCRVAAGGGANACRPPFKSARRRSRARARRRGGPDASARAASAVRNLARRGDTCLVVIADDGADHGQRDRRRAALPREQAPSPSRKSRRSCRPRSARRKPGSAAASSASMSGLCSRSPACRPIEAEALLWRLVDFTHPLDDGHQEIRWEIRRGAIEQAAHAPAWPTGSSRSSGTCPMRRSTRPASCVTGRCAAPPPAAVSGELGLVVAESRGRPLAIPVRTLPRHVIALGATGSGKSTLLLNLALAAIEADIGTTVIDPHGDLVNDVLCRIPRSATGRIHVLRLADRAHPRGFNFLERRSAGEDQLVASEFVYLLEDLWPRFSGPKMQHYLRNALLTLLADERPQTILELIRILTDDAFRERFVEAPARSDASSVLGDAVAVGRRAGSRHLDQGRSQQARRVRDVRLDPRWWSARGPRRSDRARSWIAARSCWSTYPASAATTRRSSARCSPAATTSTRSAARSCRLRIGGSTCCSSTRRTGSRPGPSRTCSVEGRKFGLALGLASQSLGGLGERLSRSVLTNAATIALLAPGSEDVRNLARLFAPVTAEQLSSLRAFEVVMRMPGRGGRPTASAGSSCRPGRRSRARGRDHRGQRCARRPAARRGPGRGLPARGRRSEPPAARTPAGTVPAMTRDRRWSGAPGGARVGRPASVPRRGVVLGSAGRSTGLLP